MTHTNVMDSGHVGTDDQLRARLIHLRKVRFALEAAKSGMMTPHRTHVLGKAVLAGVPVGAVAMVVDHRFALSLPGVLPLGLAVVVGVAYGLYVNTDTTRARTHTQVVDRLLEEYDPLDKDAYRALQSDVRACGLERDIVEMWLGKEVQAVRTALGWHTGSELCFLKKRI